MAQLSDKVNHFDSADGGYLFWNQLFTKNSLNAATRRTSKSFIAGLKVVLIRSK